MNETQRNLIYLLSCAANGITPDKEKVQGMDPEKLHRLAVFHSVSGAVCIALQMAGVENGQFIGSYKKAVRRNVYLDIERAAILADLEQQGIWYMPLKGAVLKDLYPQNGMREMADNDILYDAGKSTQVREIMLSQGYTVKKFGRWHHDVYEKPPVLNMEMHTGFFSEKSSDLLSIYYSDVRRFLRKDDGNRFGYHFSDEDFYVYMTAHEWNHYRKNGTGIRSLMDCFVYCKVKGNSLDWEYIEEQCRQLGTADFERERRSLAGKVFSAESLPALNAAETEMLTQYLAAGTYGKIENELDQKLKNQSKAGYLLSGIIPDMEYMKHSVPFVRRYPLLYPAGIVYRWGRIFLHQRKDLIITAKAVIRHDRKQQTK